MRVHSCGCEVGSLFSLPSAPTSKDVDLSIYLLKETGEIPFDATLLFPVQQSRCCELVWNPYFRQVHPHCIQTGPPSEIHSKKIFTSFISRLFISC